MNSDYKSNNHNAENNTLRKWLVNLLKIITLEPVVFVFFLALSMEGILFAEIIFQKTCLINLNYTSDVCNNITSDEEKEIEVEKYTTKYIMFCGLIQSIPSIFFVLFVGPWSDKYGRKLPIILPFIGKVIFSLLMWIYTQYWNIPTAYVYLAVVPVALSGGLPCFVMSMYSYISDISSPQSRTTRIVVLDMFIIIGPCAGLLLSNVTKENLGFSGTYIVTGVLYAVSVVYIVFCINETRGPNARSELEQELVAAGNSKLKELLNVKNILQTFKTVFTKRVNRGREKIVSLMAAICLMVFVFNSMSTEYLYSKLKFGWEYEYFIYWTVTAIGVQALGMSVIFPFLSRFLKVNDEYLSVAGCISVIAAFLLQAFAVAGYQMYIGTVIGILGGLPLAIGRSTLSKIVPEKSSGKLFSVIAALESFMPLLSTPLYTITYNATIKAFPGAFFVVSAGFYMLAMLSFLYVCWLSSKDEEISLVASAQLENEENEEME